MNKQYISGVSKEREAQQDLKDFGYYVIRASGSHGIWDLWAVNDTELRLIQVKSTRSKRSLNSLFAKEIERMWNTRVVGSQEIWCWRYRKGWEKCVIREQDV